MQTFAQIDLKPTVFFEEEEYELWWNNKKEYLLVELSIAMVCQSVRAPLQQNPSGEAVDGDVDVDGDVEVDVGGDTWEGEDEEDSDADNALL